MNQASRRILALTAVIAALLVPTIRSDAAESVDALRNRANAGTVGVVSGGVDGTYIRIAADLAAVLDDGDTLRVLPLLGKGSLQNLSDIVFLKGIDIGIVQSDVLAYAKRERILPGVEKSINYVAKLYDEELHLLARKEIANVGDLADKKVNIDLRGSGTAMTASLVFERLGIAIEPTNFDQALALEKLKTGEIAALAYVAGKPARLFRDLQASDPVHFIAVPANAALLETYLPGELAHEDYPALVPADGAVQTLAVGAVMAVYGWGQETERYRKVARFVDAFFSKFDDFLRPPRHAKWKEVNLTAQVPGWRRFPAAEAWLRREATASTAASGGSSLRRDFDAFLNSMGGADRTSPSEVQKAALFEEFLRWRNSRRSARSSMP